MGVIPNMIPFYAKTMKTGEISESQKVDLTLFVTFQNFNFATIKSRWKVQSDKSKHWYHSIRVVRNYAVIPF